MRLRAILGAVAVHMVLAAPLSGQTAPAITEFDAGGISVILKPITANDVIAVRLYLRGGSAALTPATAGIERVLGAASTRGTARYPRDRFAALATETGTEIGSIVDYDFTVLTLRAVSEHWAQAWDLFTEVALHPALAAEDVEQAKAQVIDALRQRADQPDGNLNRLADSLLYLGHPYAVDPQGTVDAVSRLTRESVAAWHAQRMTKANLLLVVVGNVSRADLSAKVAAAFAGLPAGARAATPPALPTITRDVLTVQRDLPTNYVLGTYAAPNVAAADYPAFRVATRILGESLFEEVRTKRNLSYAAAARLSTRIANVGGVYVTPVEPGAALEVMLAEVRRIQQEQVPQARLGQTVNAYVTSYLMGQQTNMGQAAELGLFEIAGGGWENATRYLDRLRAVTPADVQRAAQAYLRNARFVVIGDPSKVDRALFTSM